MLSYFYLVTIGKVVCISLIIIATRVLLCTADSTGTIVTGAAMAQKGDTEAINLTKGKMSAVFSVRFADII